MNQLIKSSGKYFLYRHIRLDKNEPFYIGIGTKTIKKIGFRSFKSEYHRANYKHSGDIYNKILRKTDHRIEIILESDDYDFIKQKEIEFIKLYGKINNNTGSLSNITNGGDGNTGGTLSEETRRKIGNNNYSKGKFGKDNCHSKKVYQYDLDGKFIREWDSISEIKRCPEFTATGPHFNQKTYRGFMWRLEYLGEKIKPVDYSEGIDKRMKSIQSLVFQYSLDGIFLKKFKSLKSVIEELGGSVTGLSSALTRKNNIYLNYLWYRDFIGEEIKVDIKYLPRIDQYDLNGNYIKTYNTTREILIDYKLGRHAYKHIKNACLNNNTRSAFKFKWKYNYDR